MTPIEKLKAQREAKNNEITRLMGLPVAENRDATVEEVRAISQLDEELVALDDAIERAERREAAQHREPASAGIRSKPPGEAPAVHTEEKKPYSLFRAIRLAADGRPLDGLEAEVSQEISRRTGRHFKGFGIPSTDDPEIRALMYPGMERRDLTTTTGAGSIYNLPKSFIELVRAKLVIQALGANIMTGMSGLFSIPRQTGANTVQWVGEGVSITPTNPTFDQVPFTPKLAIASTVISRQFLMQTSIDAERRVQDDLSTDLAIEFDRVIINGSGGSQPLGLLNNTTIQSLSTAAGLPMGTNGGPLTYAKSVAMETVVATANTDTGSLAYLIHPVLRGSLKNTFVGTAGYPIFVYDQNQINGYPARATTLMPSNTTKGTSTNCTSIIFGNWRDLTVATWDTGVDVIVDPYTGKRAGAIEITTEMAMDAHPDHEASFAIITDVTPS